MNRNNRIIQLLLAGFIAWIAAQCATPVSPTGGSKDEEPPVVVETSPPNYSLNFNGNRIILTFNEFVQLKQPNQQAIISPPLEENPEYKIRGRNVLIELQEELKANTTYSIFFGDAIVDLTEGNPLANYVYAFSTGSHIDSLALGGEVLNAFNLKPEEEVFVMLYLPDNDTVPTDSLPMLVRPLYISKTGENGIFQLKHLRNEPFRIFALRDVNSNYLFDQPNEEIAFVDSLLIPEPFDFRAMDSIPVQDTTEPLQDTTALSDTLNMDSLIIRNTFKNFQHLLMFRQIDSTQQLLDEEVFYPPKFRLNYKFPAHDPWFEVINKDRGNDWYIESLNRRRDSLTVWAKDIGLDSLQIKVADGDSILDTLMIVFSAEKKEKPKRRKDEKPEPDRLKFSANTNGRAMDLGRQLRLIFNNPLTDYSFDSVFFVAGEDTTTGAPFRPMDSINRVFRLDYSLQEETGYEFIFPDSTLWNIYGLTNDSVKLAFRTKKPGDYGNIILNMDLESQQYPYIVQLLDKNENVLREKYVESPQTIRFEYLDPAVYLLKAIQDKWKNKRWDTGDYPEKRQPENVYYFPAEVQVRANWDIEESWSLP